MTLEESQRLAVMALDDHAKTGLGIVDRVALAIRDAAPRTSHAVCKRCRMPEMSICPRCAGELFMAAVKP